MREKGGRRSIVRQLQCHRSTLPACSPPPLIVSLPFLARAQLLRLDASQARAGCPEAAPTPLSLRAGRRTLSILSSAVVERLQFAGRIHRHRSTSPQFTLQPRLPSPCASARSDRAGPSRRSRPSAIVFPGVEQSTAMSPSPWPALCGTPSLQPCHASALPCHPVAHMFDGFHSRGLDEPERRCVREPRRRLLLRRRQPSFAAFPVQPSGVLKSR